MKPLAVIAFLVIIFFLSRRKEPKPFIEDDIDWLWGWTEDDAA